MIATYITVAAPISGMSMNRFAQPCPRDWNALWIYFTAPLLGMFLAAEAYLRVQGAQGVACAKLHHENSKRCIFCGKPGTTK